MLNGCFIVALAHDFFLLRFRERIATLKDDARRRALEAELSAKAYRARLTQLEAIKYSAKVSMAQVADVEVAQDKAALQNGASIAYNRTLFDVQKSTGIMFSTDGMSTRRAAEILRQNWSGKLYSARVWNNCNAVADQVATLMSEMVMSGKASCQSMDELVGQAIDNGRKAANRLLRTEYNHIAGQAELDAYTDAKVTHYRYIAVLDGRTSKVCQELDGKVFPIAERKVGKNMHPMHPWCRSSTAPVINSVVLKNQKRIARDPKTGRIEYVPASMTYKEWDLKNKIINGKMRIVKGRSIDFPDGEKGVLLTDITDAVVFAGYGSKTPLKVKEHMVNNYGGIADQWAHAKGHAIVELQDGTSKKANVHWFEEKSVGIEELRVKGWSKK